MGPQTRHGFQHKGARRAGDRGGVILATSSQEPSDIGREDKKTLKFVDWSQTDKDVTVTLFAGRPLSERDVAVSVTQSTLNVGLTDGRKWWCDLSEPVLVDDVKTKRQKCKVSVMMRKKCEGRNWTSLEKADNPGLSATADTLAESECTASSLSRTLPITSRSSMAVEQLLDGDVMAEALISSASHKDKAQADSVVITEAVSRGQQKKLKQADMVKRELNEVEHMNSVFTPHPIIYSTSSSMHSSSCKTSLVFSTHTAPLPTPSLAVSATSSETLPTPSLAVCVSHTSSLSTPSLAGYTTTAAINASSLSASQQPICNNTADAVSGSYELQLDDELLPDEDSDIVIGNSTDILQPDSSPDSSLSRCIADSTSRCRASDLSGCLGIIEPRTTDGGLITSVCGQPVVENVIVAENMDFELLDIPSGDRSQLSNDHSISAGTGSVATGNQQLDGSNGTFESPVEVELVPESSVAQSRAEAGAAESVMDTREGLSSAEDIIEIVHMHHDSYESSPAVHTLLVMVKSIKRETVKINFEPLSVDILFQTSDKKFLDSYERSTADTWFHWKINLVGEIVPDECKYTVTPIKAEVRLHKRHARKWTSLSAAPASLNTGGDGVSVTAGATGGTVDQWLPVIPPPPPPPPTASSKPMMEGGKKGGGGVVFDELSQALRRRAEADCLCYEDEPESAASTLYNNELQKPMCAVAPHPVCDDDDEVGRVVGRDCFGARGLIGLDNLGNTCFMNSVLQVLANTQQLRDYFLDGSYRADINTTNPLGMHGQLAEAFATLMRVLWSSNQQSYAPHRLKSLIGTKQSRFAGFSQHDAEEFMEFLLDGLHEDVNRVKIKPYSSESDVENNPPADEVMAERAWRAHRSRNDSMIADTLQGQYRSKLTCPHCHKVSITFDPFSVIQVPVARKQMVDVTFMWVAETRRPTHMRFCMGEGSKMRDLKAAISQQTHVSVSNMRIMEISKSRVRSMLTDDRLLIPVSSSNMSSSNDENTLILACEVLDASVIGEAVRELVIHQRTQQPLASSSREIDSCCHCGRQGDVGVSESSAASLKRCSQCYTVAYCNAECQRKDWQRHKGVCQTGGSLVGCPFVISLPLSRFTKSKLMEHIESYARYSVHIASPLVSKSVRSDSECEIESEEVGRDESKSPVGTINSCIASSSSADIAQSKASESGSVLVQEVEWQWMQKDDLVSEELKELSSTLGVSVEVEQAQDEEDHVELYGRTVRLTFSGGDEAKQQKCKDKVNELVSKCQKDIIVKEEGTCVSEEVFNKINKQLHFLNRGPCVIVARDGKVLVIGRKDEVQSAAQKLTKYGIKFEDGIESERCMERGQQKIRQVLGTRQNTPHRKSFPFLLRLSSSQGTPVQDLRTDNTMFSSTGADGILNLPLSVTHVCMVWCNVERGNQTSVIVKDKPLERDETRDDRVQTKHATLDDCLRLFSEPEVLNADQTWYCPRCRTHCQATKQMSLWRLPDTVIVHLKRFSYTSGYSLMWRGKVDDHVDFPITGLDLSHYMSRGMDSHTSTGSLYDLYGVVNHYGGMLGGHYTAFARSSAPQSQLNNSAAPIDLGWRLFDDSYVTPCDASKVVTRYAYVLFYKRRQPPSVSGAVSKSISESVNDDISGAVGDSVSGVNNTANDSVSSRVKVSAGGDASDRVNSFVGGGVTQRSLRLVDCSSDVSDNEERCSSSSSSADDSFTVAVDSAAAARVNGHATDGDVCDNTMSTRALLDFSDDDDDDDDELLGVQQQCDDDRRSSPEIDMDAMD